MNLRYLGSYTTVFIIILIFLDGNPTSIVNGSVQHRSQEKTSGLFAW